MGGCGSNLRLIPRGTSVTWSLSCRRQACRMSLRVPFSYSGVVRFMALPAVCKGSLLKKVTQWLDRRHPAQNVGGEGTEKGDSTRYGPGEAPALSLPLCCQGTHESGQRWGRVPDLDTRTDLALALGKFGNWHRLYFPCIKQGIVL